MRSMSRQPGGDTLAWEDVLAHRPASVQGEVQARFMESGVEPGRVVEVLADGGDGLYAAARSGDPRWAERFGGQLAAALLAAEVGALTAHLTSRASAVRAAAVEALLEEFSAVSVAASLGISRQKVYDIARAQREGPFIHHCPRSAP